MKRHPSLHDYSRDHHLLLLQAREIRWYFDENRHASPLPAIVRGFLHAWGTQIAPHLREEEMVMLPWYAAQPAARAADLERVAQDHAWLRARVETLRAQVGDALDPPLLRSIGERLHDHVRWEERSLFPFIQQHATDIALATLAERALAYREAHRPQAIGPRSDGGCEI